MFTIVMSQTHKSIIKIYNISIILDIQNNPFILVYTLLTKISDLKI